MYMFKYHNQIVRCWLKMKLEFKKILIAATLLAVVVLIYNLIIGAVNPDLVAMNGLVLLPIVAFAIGVFSLTISNMVSKFKFGLNAFTIIATVLIVALSLTSDFYINGPRDLIISSGLGCIKALMSLLIIWVASKA